MLKLIHHALIHTMNPAMPRADAAVTEDGLFVFVGTYGAAKAFLSARAYEETDAGGRSLTPGFNDSHMHMASCALRIDDDRYRGAQSAEQVTALLKEDLSGAGGGWLVARGWNQDHFDTKRLLTRADLDAVSTDVPIAAIRVCGHILTANRKAMELAGVSVPEDGIFREAEQSVILSRIPKPDPADLVNRMCRAQTALYKQGITSVQSDDFGMLNPHQTMVFTRLLKETCVSRRFKARYAEQALLENTGLLSEFLDERPHELTSDTFRVSCLKILADGSLGARTAALRGSYADDPGNTGILLYTDEAIAELIGMAARRGLPSAIHTIGDGAMEQALCQLERAGRGLRHAVVHAQITGADQIVRLGRNRLQVLAQPIFLRADTPIAAARAGDAVRTSYRFKSMLMSGARVAFGSDSPVEPFDVMPNVYCAVTRKGSAAAAVLHPEEAFTMEEALFAYTAAGAYASGEEHVKGRIKPGMYADYVIWDRSLDDVLPEDIPSVRADITVIAGETIYLR